MDRRERMNDRTEALRTLLDGRQAHIWTSLPGIIVSVDLAKMTCVVQPAIQGVQLFPDGTTKNINLPVCPDVPLVFPGGGGYTLTFPVAAGDECELVFNSRCIDTWWQSGGIQPQAELRMHDLSDAFAFVGVRSQPRVLPTISAVATELRNDAGDVKVSLTETEIDVLVKADTYGKFKDGQIDLKAKNSTITLKQDEIDINATTVKINGLAWETHEHTGVTAGAAKTGGPVAP